ncbi:MAG TPA: pyruvate dehydrogenase complex dihydrolipoamide acetyltransferase [Ferrovibrio sp.]|uniref:pyruvate dehydrogenase complex dihydrolipoamide acetyltransferase n=1 Tax=Ferrovibrio sp. TaxID=1917215 RepID=UPI002ED172D7
MTIEILMPALSPTMTEGKLAKWHKKEGDEIKAGDIIAEIETDKATMEFEAVDEGKLGKILVAEGSEGVAVNTPIAVLLEEGESAADIKAADIKTGAAPKPAPQAEKAPQAKPAAAPAPSSTPVPAPAAAPQAAAPAPVPVPKHDGGRIFASPLARRMAAQAGVDLRNVQGSGPHGRIVKADIEKAPKGAAATAGAKPATPAPAGPGARQLADLLKMSYRLEPLSGTRRTIARRLTESKQTVPHFYLTIDTEIDELLALRKRLNEKSEVKISVNDFVIRAVALALKKVPAANASYDESGLMFYEHADISVAVATPNGLITPIVKQAEQKRLTQIASEMKDLAARARDGKLKPDEFQGGTFSVSNLGMFGVKQFEAVINPPQGCILAVGMGEQRPVVKNGQIVPATLMTCTLSVDHRVVDGAVGAEFLQAFKGYVDDPLTMLL